MLKDDSHLRSSFVESHFDAFDRFVKVSPVTGSQPVAGAGHLE